MESIGLLWEVNLAQNREKWKKLGLFKLGILAFPKMYLFSLSNGEELIKRKMGDFSKDELGVKCLPHPNNC